MKKLLFSVIALFMIASTASAQVAIRTNVAALAFGAPTVGVEFSIAPKWTLGFDAMINAFNPYDFYKIKGGGLLMAEGRYYFCEPFNKHHLGLYIYAGYHKEIAMENKFFNTVIAAKDYEPGDGDVFSKNHPAKKVLSGFVGLSYGYYLKLAHGWGLDFTIGGGLFKMRYENPLNDNKKETTKLHGGLNRLAIDLTYKF